MSNLQELWFRATAVLAWAISAALLVAPSQVNDFFFNKTEMFFVQVLGASLAGVGYVLWVAAEKQKFQQIIRRMSIIALLATVIITARSWQMFASELAAYVMFLEHFILLAGFTYMEYQEHEA